MASLENETLYFAEDDARCKVASVGNADVGSWCAWNWRSKFKRLIQVGHTGVRGIGAPDFGGSSGKPHPRLIFRLQLKSIFEFMQLTIRLSNKVALMGAYAVSTFVLLPYT